MRSEEELEGAAPKWSPPKRARVSVVEHHQGNEDGTAALRALQIRPVGASTSMSGRLAA